MNRKSFYSLLLYSILDCIMCINVTSRWENYMDTNRNSNCSADLFAAEKEAVLQISLGNDCEIYTSNFTSSNTDSIISIVSNIKRLDETRGDNAVRNPAGRINVVFFESNERMETWMLTHETATKKYIYLSRTASLKTEISVEGNWSEYEISFRYKEYKFDSDSKRCTDQNGEITSLNIPELGQYRPNYVTAYSLTKSEGKNINSIEITLHYLDIDVAVGEYMLIGAGEKLFHGPPPLFIASEKKTEKYLVNDENAYIVFVSGPTRFPRKGFKISYQLLETEILVPKDDDLRNKKGDDILQSMPICFYNVSHALQEFRKTDKQKSFLKFREEFAKVAKNFSEGKKPGAPSYLNASYVEVFRASGVIRFKDGEALYAMLKVRGALEGEAAFSREELTKIIDIYENKSDDTYGYKIGKCPPEYLYSKWWNIGIYSSLPVLFCLFLVMWAWKRNAYQDYCFWPEDKLKEKISKQLERGMKKKDENSTQINGNVYSPEPNSSTVPKVQLFTTTGRRYTLGPKNSFAVDLEGEEGPSCLNNTQNPSHTIDNNETSECGHSLETVFPILGKTSKQETEHFYDSVELVTSIRNDSQITETKL